MVDGDDGMEHPQDGRIEVMAKLARAFYRYLSNRVASTPMKSPVEQPTRLDFLFEFRRASREEAISSAFARPF